MSFFFRSALRSVLFLIFWTGIILLPATAQTVMLCGGEGTGSLVFAEELVRLWERSGNAEEHPVLAHPLLNAGDRLERLRSRQAHLAVIDARTAHLQLGKDLNLRVVTVLWPNWLHVIVNHLSLGESTLQSASSLLVHPNAMLPAQIWSSLVPRGKLVWWSSQHQSLETEGLFEDGILLAAPVPVEEIRHLLARFETLTLASMDDTFLSRIQLQAPWWLKWELARGAYPRQAKNLLSLASFSVLVARVDFPAAEVKRLLKLIHGQRNKINPHILFRNMNPKHNRLFRKTFHFHPGSRTFFGFK